MTEQLVPLEELQENQEIAQKMHDLVEKAHGGKIPNEKLGFVDGGGFNSVVGPHLKGRLEASMKGVVLDDFGDMPEDFKGPVYLLRIKCSDSDSYFTTPDGSNKTYVLGSDKHVYSYDNFSFFFTEQGQACQTRFLYDLTDEYEEDATIPEILEAQGIREGDLAILDYVPDQFGEPTEIKKQNREKVKDILNKLDEGYFNVDPPEYIVSNS
jgi:hypothetical protein